MENDNKDHLEQQKKHLQTKLQEVENRLIEIELLTTSGTQLKAPPCSSFSSADGGESCMEGCLAFLQLLPAD